MLHKEKKRECARTLLPWVDVCLPEQNVGYTNHMLNNVNYNLKYNNTMIKIELLLISNIHILKLTHVAQSLTLLDYGCGTFQTTKPGDRQS